MAADRPQAPAAPPSPRGDSRPSSPQRSSSALAGGEPSTLTLPVQIGRGPTASAGGVPAAVPPSAAASSWSGTAGTGWRAYSPPQAAASAPEGGAPPAGLALFALRGCLGAGAAAPPWAQPVLLAPPAPVLLPSRRSLHSSFSAESRRTARAAARAVCTREVRARSMARTTTTCATEAAAFPTPLSAEAPAAFIPRSDVGASPASAALDSVPWLLSGTGQTWSCKAAPAPRGRRAGGGSGHSRGKARCSHCRKGRPWSGTAPPRRAAMDRSCRSCTSASPPGAECGRPAASSASRSAGTAGAPAPASKCSMMAVQSLRQQTEWWRKGATQLLDPSM
mmetsp:Transcript_111/g.305  ORF Transcript_111/g.305 Transcript_111/m.305 type:complete len:336 (+) Transcript_111:505-1512(+)